MTVFKLEYVSPVIGLIVFFVTYALAGLANAFIMLALSAAIFVFIGIVNRASKLPSRDGLGKFHDSSTGRFIKSRTAGWHYFSLGSSITIALMTKLDSIAQAVPLFTSLPSEVQALAIIGGHGLGFWLNS